MNWLIYGANGYSGELIAREAKRKGLSPVLAGRRADRLLPLAGELGLEHRVFGLDRPQEIAGNLGGIDLVLHSAGPFSATSAPMIEACLSKRVHYLDITGEIDVFEHAHARSDEARRAEVVLCPGVGFDVIPTDCVAVALKKALPDAERLSLGFDSRSPMSPGTAKTSVEGLAQGGRVREGGKIVSVPLAHRVRRIDFGDGEKLAMSIPWGDVSTAYYSTGIGNIDVFVPASPRLIAGAKRANSILWLLRLRTVQTFLKKRAGRRRGPSPEKRAASATYVWGEAVNAKDERKTARIKTENGYSVTVSGSLAVVDYLSSHKVKGGTYTPATLVGDDLVTKLSGSGPLVIT
jgi:short subunit dehydrogenase-like uncharacterized protein